MGSVIERDYRLPAPHSAVVVRVWHNYNYNTDENFRVSYVATDAELIRAGIVTADMLGKGKPGKRRKDAQGRHFRICRNQHWLEIRFKSVTRDDALAMKGVTRVMVDRASQDRVEFKERHAVQERAWTAQARPNADSGSHYAAGYAASAADDPQLRQLLGVFAQLTPEGKQAVLRKARYYANQSTGRLRVIVDNESA